MKLTCRRKLQENTPFMLELFGNFYQECLLAEDRFKKEDLVKNGVFFFAKVLNWSLFFLQIRFFSYESTIRAYTVGVPYFISTFL